jgi:hypothetical protein
MNTLIEFLIHPVNTVSGLAQFDVIALVFIICTCKTEVYHVSLSDIYKFMYDTVYYDLLQEQPCLQGS